MDTTISHKRAVFFRLLLGDGSGIICIAKRAAGTKVFEEEFFNWPDDLPTMLQFIENFADTCDVWFCPQLLNSRKRKKESILKCPNVWADLDGCDPSKLLVPPTASVESSPGRWQAYWRMDTALAPLDAEDAAKRIAYYHSEDGADRSGWDLTQLLRVPYTYNHKYAGVGFPPQVKVVDVENKAYKLSDFSVYPKIESLLVLDFALPKNVQPSDQLLMRYRNTLHPMVFVLFAHTPNGKSWSESLWNLEMLLFESQLPLEDVFAIAKDAACNKYERDQRGDHDLWKEVIRAKATFEIGAKDRIGISGYFDSRDPLLKDEDRKAVLADNTIVEHYIDWASPLTDAAPVYHQAGIFTILSSVLSGGVRIPTSFGNVVPNLWFMILADTTLTRKTTAMDMAMDMLEVLDNDAVLATDGSLEGMFSAMAQRPGRSSIFLRDEFSGLLDAMFRKDYMAGMAESLTKLYDGKYQKRVLKSGTIEIRDPILILFTGGIKSRIFEQLTYDHVVSGFLPRFCFIVAEADITKLKPVGPPTTLTTKARAIIEAKLEDISKHYNQAVSRVIGGQTLVVPKIWEAELTPEAWALYNQFEAVMVNQGLQHEQRDVTMPALDRLAKSGLKCAALIAAARKLDEKIVITEADLYHAFFYVEQWREHMFTVLSNIGKSHYEKLIDMVAAHVAREPGVLRGTLMRMYRFSKHTADDIVSTAEERGLLFTVRSGRSVKVYPPGHIVGAE